MSEYQDYGFQTADPAHTFFYLQGPLLSLLDKTKNTCILDMGCGNGYISNYLIATGFNVYGTDASEDGITIANRKNPGRFYLQDFSTGELPEELQEIKFDTIISTEVIEHLYDPYKFIDMCKAILSKSKGDLLISTPYHGYFKNLMLSIFDKWDRHISPLWQGGHIKVWSRDTLTQLLIQKGFIVTDFRGCGRFPYFWKSMIVKAKL
jgi:2-polyprenyl-3-methyl-5-hydroxy-6-metoxy-1,4-benzoquinol methylase